MSAPLLVGPLGNLRELVGVRAGSLQRSQEWAPKVTPSLGNIRHVQRAPRAPSTWQVGFPEWTDPAAVRLLSAAAQGVLEGLLLYDVAEAMVNLLPPEFTHGSKSAALIDVPGLGPMRAHDTARTVRVPVRPGYAYRLSGVVGPTSDPQHIGWSWRTTAGALTGPSVAPVTSTTTSVVGVAPDAAAYAELSIEAGDHTATRFVQAARPSTRLRQNRCINPSFLSASNAGTANAGTGGTTSFTITTGSAGWVGNGYARTTWTVGTSVAGDGTSAGGGITPMIAVAVTAGEQVTFSCYVRSSKATTLAPRITWTGGPASTAGAPVAVAANTWTRVSVTTTVPAGATAGVLGVFAATGVASPSWSAGNTLDADGVLVETGGLGAYFDGNTSDTPTIDYGWDGSANGSSSSARVAPMWADAGGFETGPGGFARVEVLDPASVLQYLRAGEHARSAYTISLAQVGAPGTLS